MEYQEASEIIRTIIGSQVGLPRDSVQADDRVLEDLGLESVDAIEIMVAVERQAGVRFGDDALEGVNTVSDIVERLQAAVQSVDNG